MRHGPSGRGQRGGVRRGALLVGAGVVVAAAVVTALGWWPAERGAAEETVTEFSHVHGLEVPAWDADAVYVSTHEGLIRIGEQGAWRWVGERRHDFMGFSAHPTEAGVLYSSGHPESGSELPNPIGFMVSTDRGATWQPRALAGEADFHTMAVGAEDERIYGWNGVGEPGLFRSDDGGRDWEVVSAGAALAELGGALSLAVSPADSDVVWAGLQGGLVRNGEAGDDWEAVHTGGPVTAVVADPADGDRLLAYVATAEEGLVASRDGGDSWNNLGLVLEDAAVAHLAIHPDDPELVYAATTGADVLRSRDGGQTWEALARAGEPEGR